MVTPSFDTIFLLSPARLDGERGRALLSGRSEFAQRLRAPAGAPVAEVFAFVSSLYFRGKAAYARHFGRAPADLPAAHVITAGGGLLRLDELVTLERVRGWSQVAVREDNPHFVVPLERHGFALLGQHDVSTRFVLLGSVASNKYVAPLLGIFGGRLLYPAAFEGRGDMSRGALLLSAVRTEQELEYAPVLGRKSSPR